MMMYFRVMNKLTRRGILSERILIRIFLRDERILLSSEKEKHKEVEILSHHRHFVTIPFITKNIKKSYKRHKSDKSLLFLSQER